MVKLNKKRYHLIRDDVMQSLCYTPCALWELLSFAVWRTSEAWGWGQHDEGATATSGDPNAMHGEHVAIAHRTQFDVSFVESDAARAFAGRTQ